MSFAAASPSGAPPRGHFHRFWRALRQLALELVGACFAMLGIVWLSAALRSWHRDIAHWLVVVSAAIGVAMLFFFFAASSFRRARRL